MFKESYESHEPTYPALHFVARFPCPLCRNNADSVRVCRQNTEMLGPILARRARLRVPAAKIRRCCYSTGPGGGLKSFSVSAESMTHRP